MSALAKPAGASIVTWDGSCGTSRWTDCCPAGPGLFETNWSLGQFAGAGCDASQFPTVTDDVDLGANSVELDSPGVTSINSLATAGPLTLSVGATLRVETFADYQGPLSLHSGGLVHGEHTASGGLMVGADLPAEAARLTEGAALILDSDAVWTLTGPIMMEEGTSLIVAAGNTLDLQSDATLSTLPDAVIPVNFTNNGVILKSSGSGESLISVRDSIAIADARFTNNGRIDIQSGTLRLNARAAHNGELHIESGATGVLEGFHTFESGSSRTGGGILNAAGSCSFYVENGVDLHVDTVNTTATTISGEGKLVVDESLTVPVLRLSDGHLEIAAGATAVATGFTEARQSQIDILGQFLLPNQTSLRGSLGPNESEFVVAEGGEFVADGQNTIDTTILNFTNHGTFRRKGPSTNTTFNRPFFYNHGQVIVESGELRFIPTATSLFFLSGEFHVNAGAQLTLGSATLLDGLVIDGDGNARLDQMVVPPDADVTMDNVTFGALPIQLDGTIHLLGNCDSISSKLLEGTGEFHVVPTGVVKDSGSFTLRGQTRLRNAGAVQVGLSSYQVVEQGSIINEPGGVIRLTSSGGIRGITTTSILNQGSIVKSGASSSVIIPAIENHGILELQGGQLKIESTFSQSETGTLLLSGGSLTLFPSTNPVLTLAAGRVEGSGQLLAGHMLNTGATIAPGSPVGGIKLNGQPSCNYTQGPAATLEIDLAGTVQQKEHDVLKVSGTAALAGTLRIIRAPVFNPPPGGLYTILECAERIGKFEDVELVGFPKGTRYNLKYYPDHVLLSVATPN